MNIEESLNQLISNEKDFLIEIKEKEILSVSLSNTETYNLSVNIVGKIISIQEDILTDKFSLIKYYASLRYLLETLILTELLIKEPSYTFKLYYSLFNHQVEKTKKIIARIEKEISIMKNYDLIDKENSKIIIDGVKNNETIEVSRAKYKKAEKELDDKADIEYTMFCGDFKSLGYGFTQYRLENELLPKYKSRLEDFKKDRTDRAKNIVNNEYISNLFDFKRQHSRVFNEFIDKRSWEKKAEITNLEDEYKLVYDLSSAILHSTSYSYLTNPKTSDQELDMILNLCFKYSKKIMINIKLFSKIESFKKFIIIKE